jgi:hypothetical protein
MSSRLFKSYRMVPRVKNFIIEGVLEVKFSPKFISELNNFDIDGDVIQKDLFTKFVFDYVDHNDLWIKDFNKTKRKFTVNTDERIIQGQWSDY